MVVAVELLLLVSTLEVFSKATLVPPVCLTFGWWFGSNESLCLYLRLDSSVTAVNPSTPSNKAPHSGFVSLTTIS